MPSATSTSASSSRGPAFNSDTARAAENRKVRLASGQEFEGPRLAHLVGKMVTISKLLARVEKKGIPRVLAERLLRGKVKDGDIFTDKAQLMELIRPLRDSKPGGSYMSITLADGTKLDGTGPGQSNSAPTYPSAAPPAQ